MLLSTEDGAAYIHNVLNVHQSEKKNVVITITIEFSMPDGPGIDSMLRFHPGSMTYPELRRFR